MKTQKQRVFAILLTLRLSAQAAEDPFAAFKALDKDELFPRNAELSFRNGAISINGSPRFIIGTTFFENADLEAEIKTTGYPRELDWLYESLPDYESAQRLGLDAFGATPDHSWRRIFRPRPIPRRNMTVLRRPLSSGLPILAELALEKGSHAWMTLMEGVNPPEGSWFEGESSGIPYSVVSDDGVALWRTIWSTDTAYYKQLGVSPFAYRLFANADFFDTSAKAKSAFTKNINARFKSLDELNKAWKSKYTFIGQASKFNEKPEDVAAYIEYTKFLEDSFARLCSNAVSVVYAASGNTNAAVFFQPKSIDCEGIDIFKASRNHRVLSAPTSNESPVLVSLFMQAVADGRPVFSPDVPVGDSAAAVRNAVLSQFARGYSVSYLGKWMRNSRLWTRYAKEQPLGGGKAKTVMDLTATEQAGRQAAAAYPDCFMNPYRVPPAALSGIRAAKKDILAAGDVFAYRNRTNNTPVALLHSRPSERLSNVRKDLGSSVTLGDYADALSFAHYKTAIVLEEQLASGIQNRYKLILAPDSSFAAYDATPGLLRKFAEDGGTVVLAASTLTLNEYGNAVTNATIYSAAQTNLWKDGDIGGNKVRVKNIGTGRIIRLADASDPATLQKKLDRLLAALGIQKMCLCLDPATGREINGIEITHSETPDGTQGLILFNRTATNVIAAVNVPGIEKPIVRDVCHGKILDTASGGFTLSLEPDNGEIIILSGRHGGRPSIPEAATYSGGSGSVPTGIASGSPVSSFQFPVSSFQFPVSSF